MPHRYNRSSEYEKFWQPIADEFYTSKYPKCELKRYNSNSSEDIEFQKKDIDLTLILEDTSIYISEKFRKEDYGDLLIEIYSKYPSHQGWMANSHADYLAYYAKDIVYIIEKHGLIRWFEEENFVKNLSAKIEDFHKKHMHSSVRSKIKWVTKSENKIQIDLIQAFNQSGSDQWHTLSLAIAWNDLKKEGLSFKKYKLSNRLS